VLLDEELLLRGTSLPLAGVRPLPVSPRFDPGSLDDPPRTLPDAASPREVVPLLEELCDQAVPPTTKAPLKTRLEIANDFFLINRSPFRLKNFPASRTHAGQFRKEYATRFNLKHRVLRWKLSNEARVVPKMPSRRRPKNQSETRKYFS
jgi:hypothetical protein